MLIPNINEQYHLYAILLIASLLIGLFIPGVKLAKAGIRKDVLVCVGLLNLMLALFFGKIYTMISEGSLNVLRTGFSSLGGLIGFLAGTYIFYFICDKDKRILENYILSLPLIYAISKMGCFFAGCCHGMEYSGIFCVRYDVGSACRVESDVFPVQLAETVVFLGIYLLFSFKKMVNNKVTVILLVSAVAKFSLDFFRYSHMGKIVTSNQIVCVVIIILCIALFVFGKRKMNTFKWG